MQDQDDELCGEPDNDANLRAAAADEMSDEEWLEALLGLNSWAQRFDPNHWGSDDFLDAKGRDISRRLRDPISDWNVWACRVLALRPALQAGTRKRQLFDDLISLELDRLTPRSKIDFRERTIPGDVTSQGDLRADLLFARARMHGEVRFSDELHGSVDFESCRFAKTARFGLDFRKSANFTNAKFESIADFRQANFHDVSFFQGAQFQQGALFGGSVFVGNSVFRTSRFSGDAQFEGVTFENECDFVDASFAGGAYFVPGWRTQSKFAVPARFLSEVDFSRCSFTGSAAFRDAQFSRKASFRSIGSKVAFSLEGTRFARLHDFTDATFHEPPRLDDCYISVEIGHPEYSSELDQRRPDRFFGIAKEIGIARDKDEHARLRKLRKMAADARDHENELNFNGYEIAARRFWVDEPNEARFWLGWLYGLTSNYGQSIFRPLVLWIVSIPIFWFVIQFTTLDDTAIEPGKCHKTFEQAEQQYPQVASNQSMYSGLGSAGQSFTLAFRNAFVIDRPDAEVARRVYGCLYGLQNIGTAKLPIIPLSVTLISALQSIVSAIFLFLLGLGLRNMFRMK